MTFYNSYDSFHFFLCYKIERTFAKKWEIWFFFLLDNLL